jgi:hypothetical protein
MNRRQAGEDFYFLQKIIPDGEFYEIAEAVIHPSPRPSFRVPFGTGASITSLTGESLPALTTYDPDAFTDLTDFFSKLPVLFHMNENEIDPFRKSSGKVLSEWLLQHDFQENLLMIQRNSSGLNTFLRRFYRWFNGLMILRYLNYSHNGYFHKIPISLAAAVMLEKMKQPPAGSSVYDLLMSYRKFERENPVFYSWSGLQYQRKNPVA